jgi:hypothetical protein
MWWQQTSWKLPPAYTDHPEQAFGETGLAYWRTVTGKSAAIPLQADFINQIVLPHFRGRRSRLLCALFRFPSRNSGISHLQRERWQISALPDSALGRRCSGMGSR